MPPSLVVSARTFRRSRGGGNLSLRHPQHLPARTPPIVVPAEAGIQRGGVCGSPTTTPHRAPDSPHPVVGAIRESPVPPQRELPPPPPTELAGPNTPLVIPAKAGIQRGGAKGPFALRVPSGRTMIDSAPTSPCQAKEGRLSGRERLHHGQRHPARPVRIQDSHGATPWLREMPGGFACTYVVRWIWRERGAIRPSHSALGRFTRPLAWRIGCRMSAKCSRADCFTRLVLWRLCDAFALPRQARGRTSSSSSVSGKPCVGLECG